MRKYLFSLLLMSILIVPCSFADGVVAESGISGGVSEEGYNSEKAILGEEGTEGKGSSPFENTKVTEEETGSEDDETASAKVVTDNGKQEEAKSDGEFPVDGIIQGDNLRLRQWPWGPVMDKFNTGKKITVTGVDGEFYKVTVDGVEGYMHKNYVSIPGAEASKKAPYYPGNTKKGGYLSKEEGTQKSKDGAEGKVPTTEESGDLANYPGGKLPQDKFIALFGPVAQASMKETGVPASVTLAQAILETGWGGSTIGDAKNLFGIKGTGPAGTTVVSTQECYDGTYVTIKDGFRKYNTWQESIDDHANLVSNGRYKSAWDKYQSSNHDREAAHEFARGIHQAGYATSPTYSDTLISLIDQYNLDEWDI